VLLDEVISFLHPEQKGTYLDCTIGAGGHSREILERIVPGGSLVGIDQDKEMLNLAEKRLKNYGKNLKLIQSDFAHISEIFKKGERFNGILYDLGLCFFQIWQGERGFSFSVDGPLDMRFNQKQELTAFELINKASPEEIRRILRDYGEEYYADRIVSAIIRERKLSPIRTTLQLEKIVFRAVPGKRKRIHPATKTFQALRIAVNKELESLAKTLPEAIKLLRKKGRVAVISFHSLEDRLVKTTFRKFEKSKLIKVITPSPVVATQMERCINPLSRSAKLRVAEKE